VARGLAYQRQKMSTEARDAYRRAVALDPKPLRPQLLLVRANMDCQDWKEASRTADVLIAADAKHSYLEAYLYQAIALYLLRDMERAEARAKQLLQLDKAHRIPRAEYVLGLILQERKDLAAAREHMARYLELQPEAADAPAVRTRIESLGKPQEAAPVEEISAPDLTVATRGEAAVPGGLKAFRRDRPPGEPADLRQLLPGLLPTAPARNLALQPPRIRSQPIRRSFRLTCWRQTS